LHGPEMTVVTKYVDGFIWIHGFLTRHQKP
jgi:hypothetical protein